MDITVDGRTVSQEAYALDYTDDDVPYISQASRAARAALRDFISAAQQMVGSDSEPYQSHAIFAYRLSSSAETAVDPEFGQEPRVWPGPTIAPLSQRPIPLAVW